MSTVPVGSIRLWDEVSPALQAGLYRLGASLEIVQTSNNATLPPPPVERTHVVVTGTRFALGPDEISDCHPPANAVGDFDERLPHAVLGRRSLPWERRLAGSEPWLAVIVARADEADLLDPKPLKAAVGNAVFGRLSAREPIAGDGPPVRTLVFKSGDTLRAVLPAKAELGLLSHVRQVNLADSALAGADDDGWFAVVAANRLPLAPSGPTPYLACVVSLEERDELWTLPAGSAAPPLVVLISWSFTSAAGGTFEELVKTVDVGVFGEEAPEEDGSVPLEHTDRSGATGESRYVGPFLASAPEEDRTLSAEPGDVTAAAAFELGRLLAAADGHFTREIVAWHRAADAAAGTAQTLGDVSAALAAAAPPPRDVAAVPRAAPEPGTPLAPAVAAALLGRVAAAHRPADPWQVPPAAAALSPPVSADGPARAAAAAAAAPEERLAALAAARATAAAEEEGR